MAMAKLAKATGHASQLRWSAVKHGIGRFSLAVGDTRRKPPIVIHRRQSQETKKNVYNTKMQSEMFEVVSRGVLCEFRLTIDSGLFKRSTFNFRGKHNLVMYG
jgi:hypothetical protein